MWYIVRLDSSRVATLVKVRSATLVSSSDPTRVKSNYIPVETTILRQIERCHCDKETLNSNKPSLYCLIGVLAGNIIRSLILAGNILRAIADRLVVITGQQCFAHAQYPYIAVDIMAAAETKSFVPMNSLIRAKSGA